MEAIKRPIEDLKINEDMKYFLKFLATESDEELKKIYKEHGFEIFIETLEQFNFYEEKEMPDLVYFYKNYICEK